MQIDRFCEGLLNFLQASPTPFHAVQTMALALEQTGFQYLDEAEDWNYPTSGNYYTIRNDASIIAFRLGQEDEENAPNKRLGFNMVGAHTDSPGLKVKPNPDQFKENYWQLGVEVYGSPLLHTWFDRDLSIAGRVHYIDENHGLYRTLIDFEQPVATIPSLAIHLNRTANDKSSINAQKHVLPVLMQTESTETFSLKHALLERLKLATDHMPQEVLDFDLYLYDSQAPRTTGFAQEFIASARLDNLLSCYVGLMSLLNSDPNQRSLLVCNDHEEVGSQSACGAQGPFLADTLKRLFPDYETYCQCIAQSFLISVDNAHAVHPNYADRHDPKHAPRMNHGPAIKINANQRYATTSETSAVVQYLAQVVKVPLQSFVSRSDLACGSTIGPLTSAEVGVRTVDLGVPQFAMHSARELASKADSHALFQLLNAFFSLPAVPSAQAIRPDLQRQTDPEPAADETDDQPDSPTTSRPSNQRSRSSRPNQSRPSRGASSSASEQHSGDRYSSASRQSSSESSSRERSSASVQAGDTTQTTTHTTTQTTTESKTPATNEAAQSKPSETVAAAANIEAQESNTESSSKTETETKPQPQQTSEPTSETASQTTSDATAQATPDTTTDTTQGTEDGEETKKSNSGNAAGNDKASAAKVTSDTQTDTQPDTEQRSEKGERRTRPNRGRGRSRPSDKRRRNNDRSNGRNRDTRSESSSEHATTQAHQSENTAALAPDANGAPSSDSSKSLTQPTQEKAVETHTDANQANTKNDDATGKPASAQTETPATTTKDDSKQTDQQTHQGTPTEPTAPTKAPQPTESQQKNDQVAIIDPTPTQTSAEKSSPANAKPETKESSAEATSEQPDSITSTKESKTPSEGDPEKDKK